MSRILAVIAAAVLCSSFTGCQMVASLTGSAPSEVVNSMYVGDLADAKEGRWVTYTTEGVGPKTTITVKVVGKDGDNTWLEYWMETGSMGYGYLLVVGKDKKISKAWSMVKDGKEWKDCKVTEPPKAGEAPKSTVETKESDEKKEVKAGAFQSHKLDVTTTVDKNKYTSVSWFSKDVWKLYTGSEHGGLVAMEAGSNKTWLEGKGEDGKPTIELPKK
jgi:hypothetical protein